MEENLLSRNSNLGARKLDQLVENKTTYNAAKAELNIYETFTRAESIELKFSLPVLTSMISGRKVMHLQQINSFDYLPGESLILPANELMKIDFPEAREGNPTKCLALAISPEFIQETLLYMDEHLQKPEEEGCWQFINESFHLLNDQAVASLLNRMIQVVWEGNKARDIFMDFCLKELLIRLLQTHARGVLIHQCANYQHSYRMAYVIKFIQDNLHRLITIKELANKACMSESNFYRCFKNEFGVTPLEFITAERIRRAKKMLLEEDVSITEACYACGFNSISYFISQFKKMESLTPKQFTKKVKARF